MPEWSRTLLAAQTRNAGVALRPPGVETVVPRPLGPPDDRVGRALAAIAAGRPVVVTDDADRENEGDLVFAAEHATAQLMAFVIRHTSGFVCVALPGEECDRLDLPPMHRGGGDRFGTAYRVTVDLRGNGTGISGAARARTVAALASARSTAADFDRPGHVVPLRARDGGVLTRRGHTEAAVDLARLAGCRPVAALCEIVSVDHPTRMAAGAELVRFAREHGLESVSIAELVAHRRRTEPLVRRVAGTRLPTTRGEFRVLGYQGVLDGTEHLALVAGPLQEGGPVRVHTECLAGDVFGALGCACGAELDRATRELTAAGRGVLVYVRPAGGARACGLLGVDRADAGVADIAAAILADLGATPGATRVTAGVPGRGVDRTDLLTGAAVAS